MSSLSKNVIVTHDNKKIELEPRDLIAGGNSTLGMTLAADLRIIDCTSGDEAPAESAKLVFFGTFVVKGDETFMGRTEQLTILTEDEETPIAKFVSEIGARSVYLDLEPIVIDEDEVQTEESLVHNTLNGQCDMVNLMLNDKEQLTILT
eukprot:310856_1